MYKTTLRTQPNTNLTGKVGQMLDITEGEPPTPIYTDIYRYITLETISNTNVSI